MKTGVEYHLFYRSPSCTTRHATPNRAIWPQISTRADGVTGPHPARDPAAEPVLSLTVTVPSGRIAEAAPTSHNVTTNSRTPAVHTAGPHHANRLKSMALTQALAALCDQLTAAGARYPGTNLVLRYEVKSRPSPA